MKRTRADQAMANAISMKSPAHHRYRARLYLRLAIRALAFMDSPPAEERRAFVRWRNKASLDQCIDVIVNWREGGEWPWRVRR